MLRHSRTNKRRLICILFILPVLLCAGRTYAEEQLDAFDQQVLEWTKSCVNEVEKQFELFLVSGVLTTGQLFDTFYIPIPNTTPQKYHTQYDGYTDEAIRPIIDKYMQKSDRIAFVVVVDRNGYLPTHNTRYTQPITGDQDHDTKWNRTKRIFNDTTGLAAAKNTEIFLLQKYSRDSGEIMKDLSIPIHVNGRHWGAVRIGYK